MKKSIRTAAWILRYQWKKIMIIRTVKSIPVEVTIRIMRGLIREVGITIDHEIDGEDAVGPVTGPIILNLHLNIITNPVFQTLLFMDGVLLTNQVLCRDLLSQFPSKVFLF